MPLGDITKQLASQAIRNAVNPPPPAPRPENAGSMILAQLQAMQKALKEDEELVVLFHSGSETIRVFELFFPSWQVVVLTGVDREKANARVVAAVESLQLVCKVAHVAPPATPAAVKFFTPKPKAG